MKTRISFLFLLVTGVCMMTVSCNKNDQMPPDSAENLQIQSDDQSRVAAENDLVADDANLVMNHPTFSQFGFNSPSVDSSYNGIVCDATVTVDTMSNPRKITITYNGTACTGNRSRTGKVIIAMAKGMHWGDKDAVLTVTLQNLTIKRLNDNKSIKLNGTHVITNTTGGRLINLSNVGTITHTVTSNNMSITFDDGRQRTWQVAKQRTFTYNNGVVITGTGLHSDATNQGIAEWGMNRFGRTFVSVISQPVVVRQDCSFRLVSGQIQMIRPDVTTTATFGLDVNGNATTCPGTSPFYLKLVWTGDKTYTFILPY